MANSNVVLLSMFLIVASLISLSHSLITINGVQVGQLEVRGLLDCSLNGDQRAVPGTLVIFRCAGSNTTLAQAVTNPNGAFTFVVNLLNTALFEPSECGVTANLPAATCDISPPDGVVTASIELVNVILASPFSIAKYITGPFLDATL